MNDDEPFDEIMGSRSGQFDSVNGGPPPAAFPSALSNSFSHGVEATDELGSNYQFRRSESDVSGTSRQRKYLWDDPNDDSHLYSSPSKIRDDALKVLDMVDGNLQSQYHVSRTGSSEMPYRVERTASGGISSGVGENKKRVPSALSGLDLGSRGLSQPASGRFSIRDPKYLDDEEEIVLHSREAEPARQSWSSRYSLESSPFPMTRAMSGKEILADMEREEHRQRMSARNMIASNAHNLTSWLPEGKSNVFGSGFSFRQNHVFGKNQADRLLDETNLRTAWQDHDMDGGNVLPPPPPVHKTWQQSLLNKQRRRRLLLLAAAIGLVVCTTVIVGTTSVGRKSVSASVSISERSPVTFYVSSDVPHGMADEVKFVQYLENLPDDAEFIVHLGNVQDPSSKQCPDTRYSDVASILEKSSSPMFVLPGAHDWIECPNPDESLDLWQTSFGEFESNFDHDLDVYRQRERVENFALLHKNVLFIGLHLVTGPIPDQTKWNRLVEDNLKFFFGMLNLNEGKFQSLVIFGSARPGPQHELFFDGVMELVEDLEIPVAYIHANDGLGPAQEYLPFENHEEILAIQTESGGKNPPVRVEVGSGSRPFILV